MKKIFTIISLLAIFAGTQAQNVGIGTTTPGTKLTVYGTGAGIEHTDGTVSIKSVIGSGYGFFGTISNHPLYLSANNNTGQLVVMPTGIIGIGNSTPTLAGLVADKKIGAVNAIFGSGTTGIALESSFPGVGFNSYYNNGRKYIATGYGGVIGFNPTNGNFTVAGTSTSGAANAAATTNDLLTATAAGNIGVGTSAPTAKLHVVGNLNLTDGTQGDGKILTSDAAGNASWQAGAYGNTERFMFTQLGTASYITRYNYGTAAIVTPQATGYTGIMISKSGLYHFDINVFSHIRNSNSVPTLELFGGIAYPSQPGLIKDLLDISTPYTLSRVYANQASIDKSFDLYITAGTVLYFFITGTTDAENDDTLEIAGNLIAQ